MTDKLPLTMLAQLDDVTVFQTAALQTADFEDTDFKNPGLEGADFKSTESETYNQKSQKMLQTEQASYGELNLGLHVADNPAQVLDNRMRLLAAINQQLATQQRASIKRLHWVNQVHGKQIHDVDVSPLSMRPVDADALVSQQAELGLAIMTADCVPIVLYQPASGQIAAIHAGWQGLACGIIKTTAERFESAGQIIAWIGVSISQAHYELGSQVRDKLLAGCIESNSLSTEHLDNFAALFSIPANSIDGSDKIKLDLPKLAAYQLETLGICVSNDSDIDCSYADPRYYSYRRQTHLQQPATGRMALIVVRSLAI